MANFCFGVMPPSVNFPNLVPRISSNFDMNYVTPNERHTLQDVAILARRHEVYSQARERHPKRWSGDIRNWSTTGAEWLNPEKENQPMNQAA